MKNLINKSLVVLTFIFVSLSFQALSKSAPKSFADLAERLSPSVVNISTTTIIEDRKIITQIFHLAHHLKSSLNNLKTQIKVKGKLNH